MKTKKQPEKKTPKRVSAVRRSKPTFEEIMQLIKDFEDENKVQITINIDVDFYNIILMLNEWEVDGTYSYFKAPVTLDKVKKALMQTKKLLKERKKAMLGNFA